MKSWHRLLCSFLLTLAVWLPISWPLPSMFSDGIPVGVSKRSTERLNTVHMMPGDHLQFLYYMWLTSDYLSGHTPFFYNLYEFNTGNDADRYRPGSYYFPFSVAFSFFYLFGDQAFAWNAVSFLALWLACWFTWLLARRYIAREAIAAIAALLAILFPFQWIQLFGGSPAGFGMVMIPLLLLGIDRAVRDEKMRGAWYAGFAILAASCTDTHVFFFGALMIPLWCVVAFTQRTAFDWKKPAAYWRLARVLAPLALMAVLSLLQTQIGTRDISESTNASGRSIHEAALFSPRWRGLWAWHELDISYHIYLGYLIVALLALGLVVLTVRAIRQRSSRAIRLALLLWLLGLGIAGIIMLSMGPFGPAKGVAFVGARTFIPGYTMIRQPAKIFVILPALLALGTALSLDAITERLPRGGKWILLLCVVGFYGEYFFQSKLLITRIDDSNAAYAAAADDALARAKKPRALILPIWPGDSHYASIYQYYASLYRIRMINGYTPFVPREYVEGVFDHYQTLNLGYASGAQLDELLGRGIEHVLLHEDLYPEKVSPFPVGVALAQLLNNPRLALLKQDGPVWAFRILPTAEAREPMATDWSFYFPANHLETERQRNRDAAIETSADASGGAYIHLADDAFLTANPIWTLALPEMRWWVRARGKGHLRAERFIGGTSIGTIEQAVEFEDWAWIEIPAGTWDGVQSANLKFTVAEGSVDVDLIKLSAGEWDALEPGESMELGAPNFFHAGNIDLTTDSVEFVPDRDRSDLVFYGPKLPLTPGHYRITIEATTTSNDTGLAGFWVAACPEGNEIARASMSAGPALSFDVNVPNNQPFLLAFSYAGKERVTIHRVILTRVRGPVGSD